MNTLTKLESAVLEKLFDGDTPELAALRAQLGACDVVSRRTTGVGFATSLVVDRSRAQAVLSKRARVAFGDVQAQVPGLQHGAGFVVFIQDGYLIELEGYTYDEPWPQRLDDFELSFVRGEMRDLSPLVS